MNILENIGPDDFEKLTGCLKGKKRRYRAGDTILTYDGSIRFAGIICSGTVRLERIDYSGERCILERMGEYEIFGEILAYSSAFPSDRAIHAVCETDCEVILADADLIIHPCRHSCPCHMTLMTNLLTIISHRTRCMSKRLEVLSQRSIRARILCYFSFEADSAGGRSFTLPMSATALADYLCVDRSAMSREMSRMKKEGLFTVRHRRYTLPAPEGYRES